MKKLIFITVLLLIFANCKYDPRYSFEVKALQYYKEFLPPAAVNIKPISWNWVQFDLDGCTYLMYSDSSYEEIMETTKLRCEGE